MGFVREGERIQRARRRSAVVVRRGRVRRRRVRMMCIVAVVSRSLAEMWCARGGRAWLLMVDRRGEEG